LVYLSTTKETFGIGVLEAMASGVPVLGVAHGGNVDLIQHGINGYLAEPGNIEDLAEGLNYCLQHRDVLGSNGQELVKQWTWDAVCEQVARIYEMALEPEPPTVAVVIPVYNKDENEFRRALNSVFGQSCRLPLEIFVIDDGSSNSAEIERVVRETKDIDAGIEVEYIYQNNSGVANARNRGVSLSRAKYICCLDSDDAIEPDFIRVCVQALEADRSLGIAYTGLRYVKPDGESVTSKWPPDSNFDNQLKKQNQIPTCCVFRREMWERLGGYNQKYAPDGAGAEDGEFWLRSGAYGWGAKKVTDEPLFVYYGGGLVGGNPNYVEPDWTALHPWTKDGKHPFASVATPRRFSHPVRQYDEPVVSVIIPVGPGHENRARDALDSLEAQTFRKWEAIVVWDCDTGVKAIGSTVDNDKFSIIVAANIRPEIRAIAKSYPYIHHWTTDKQGPGYARNRGAEIARAPFLVFLDADDTLYPTFLERHLEAWREHQSIIYADFVGKAMIDDPGQLDQSLQRNIYHRNERTGETIIGYKDRQDADYDCERAQMQPENPPYIWCNVTALIPKAWHNETGGFDESMPSWEDVDYHWRMAMAGKCYHRIQEELMVYYFHTGHRREHGRQEYKNLIEYLGKKYKGVAIMPCSGCGGNRRSTGRSTVDAFGARRQSVVKSIPDNDFVMADYIHPNKGKHQVTGGFVFQDRLPNVKMVNRGNGWSINYGQHGGGERFLVHRADVQVQQHLFRIVQAEIKETAPEVKKEPTPEPTLIAADVDNSDFVGAVGDGPIVALLPEEKSFDLQMLPGIGNKLAEQLENDGIKTAKDVKALGVDGLSAYRGVGKTKAALILRTIEGMEKAN
jgi:glycosyltransferase involved in cell wall biosynthesis